MEEAKDIHTSLRKASGIMKFVQDTLLPQVITKSILISSIMLKLNALLLQLGERPKNGSDLDVRVIAAYLNQCTAEAQGRNLFTLERLTHSYILSPFPRESLWNLNLGHENFMMMENRQKQK